MDEFEGMTMEMLKDTLDRCFKNTNILEAKDKSANGKGLINLVKGKGYAPLVKKLLKEGADVNLKNDLNYTPLHIASEKGHLEVAEMLIDFGNADVDVKDKNQFTPIYVASSEGHIDILELLLSTGANVNCKHIENWTPLH